MLVAGVVLLLLGYLLPDFTVLPAHVDAVLLTAGWILAILGVVVLVVDLVSSGSYRNNRWWW